ncbi:MAG: hypothetical protein JSV08_08300 [Acidobacteriota bacterium]|nr:MAG: hypothetical protein JSV08_08300 [Acidobacteriota bacterium]
MEIRFELSEERSALLIASLRRYLKKSRFEERLKVRQIEGNSIFEFGKEKRLVSLVEERTTEETRTLVFSCDSEDVDLEELLLGGFSLFAREVHKSLLGAVPSGAGKNKFLNELRKSVAELRAKRASKKKRSK